MAPTKKRVTSAAPRARRKPAAHLLIVECESDKLAAQGLAIGSEIHNLAKQAFPNKEIVLVRTSTTPRLLEQLSEVCQRHPRFRTVLIVGHSNAQGLKLTDAPRLCAWSAVGEWFAQFDPEFVLLTACEAGQSLPAGKLFSTVKSLKSVYASPTKLYRDQAFVLIAVLHQLLTRRKMDRNLWTMAQAINVVITRGLFYKWTRAEFRPGREIDGKLWDLAAALSALIPRNQ